MKDLHPEHAIEQLEREAGSLAEGELRRRCEKLAALMRDLLERPEPRWVQDNQRLIDRYVFTRPTMESLPAEQAAQDPDHLYTLLWLIDFVQHSLRQELRRLFSLRPIIATEQEAYDEHSPRFAVNRTRATGNNALDWCVAQTVALGFEWDATPAVLRPARVDVYRYVDSAREPEIWSITPPAVACGSRVEMTLRGAGLGEVRSAWVGGSAATVTSSCEDLVTLIASVPLTPGPLEVETSSLQDAQVPALHRDTFHGFAVAYEPLRLEVVTAVDGSPALRCHPPEPILHPRDAGATWTLQPDEGEPGVWLLNLQSAPPPFGCLQGTAERRFSVLSGSAEGLRDLEVRVDEAFVVVSPLREAGLPPATPSPPPPPVGDEVTTVPAPHDEQVDAPSREEPPLPEEPPAPESPSEPALIEGAAPLAPLLAPQVDEAMPAPPPPPVREGVHVILITPEGERVALSPLPPGSRIEIRISTSLADEHGEGAPVTAISPILGECETPS